MKSGVTRHTQASPADGGAFSGQNAAPSSASGVGYVPPFAVLRRAAKCKIVDGKLQEVTLSGDAFRLLLRVLYSNGAFSHEDYLARYPDVAKALREGILQSSVEHFVTTGYFEDRLPRNIDIDEGWYLAKHQDVARSVASGQLIDALTHFEDSGYLEGRAPDAAQERAADAWLEQATNRHG